VTISRNILKIESGYFKDSTKYKVVCSGTGEGGQGASDIEFSTILEFNVNLTFAVSPNAGVSYSTVFNFTVTASDPSDSFYCNFGYTEMINGR